MNNIRKHFRTEYIFLAILIMFVLILGISVRIALLKADSTTTASVEAEAGGAANGATVVADSSASGGSAVRFGAIVTPPPTDMPPMPDATNTGPRIPLTRSLTPDQALAELRTTKKLSGVRITGGMKFSGSDGRGWVIEDSRIEGSSNYGVQSYVSLTAFTGTQAERPVLRYVEIIGAAGLGTGRSAAVIYGSDLVLQNADIYGADDGIKSTGRMDIVSSWLHDNDHPSGAHCDAIQIRGGLGIIVRYSRIDAYVGYSSDGSQAPDGDTCSGGLQTGSVTGDISAVWEHNWFAGGHYTIRGAGSRDAAYNVDYVFRNNRFLRNGTSVALGLTNLPPHLYGPRYGDVGIWENNVWDDTGQLVP
jgi:hypothetical protein